MKHRVFHRLTALSLCLVLLLSLLGGVTVYADGRLTGQRAGEPVLFRGSSAV